MRESRHLYNWLCVICLAMTLTMASCTSDVKDYPSTLGFVRYTVDVDEVAGLPAPGVFSLTMMSADSIYSHTWANIADVTQMESFLTGAYKAVATAGDPNAEGYGCQCYIGEESFEITGLELTDVTIPCRLAQAMVNVEISSQLQRAYPSASVTMHTTGHAYVDYDPQAETPALVVPGSTYFYVKLEDVGGHSVTVAPNFLINTRAAQTYNVKVGYADGNLLLSCADVETSIALTDELFHSACPTVVCSGFTAGEPLVLVEGYPADSAVVMDVDAPAGLKYVLLTSVGTPAAFDGFPAESNLMNMAPALAAYGLKVEKLTDKKIRVDFTKILESLSVTANSDVSFMVQACDMLNRVSDAALLKVEIKSIDFGLMSQTAAPIGSNIASVSLKLNSPNVEAADFSVYITDENGRKKMRAPIVDFDKDEANNLVTLQFYVGEGTDKVPVIVEYMGNPKVSTVIERTVEEYDVAYDAFALSALVNVQGADSATTAAIVTLARVMNGDKELAVDTRSPSRGLLRVVGLEPSKAYDLKLRTIEGGFEPMIHISTESAATLPDADFEDVDDIIRYSGLKSGGIYSASAFPVFNIQNTTDINVRWMRKSWASVNDKTFCRSARNHNTWYMQPSANMDYKNYKSGSKAVVISSVGWSLKGPEIEPYMQQPGEYLRYNANVPEQDHVSAGRLFLGSYSFNAATGEETYKEGISFGSRPSSLNGFYKYLPCGTDNGLVKVEVVSEITAPPTVLASAEMRLPASPDYVAFNLPITYDVLNLKATRIRVMFASSYHCGTIAEEDMNVPVAPDPATATFMGSRLWIDNLSLSYAY